MNKAFVKNLSITFGVPLIIIGTIVLSSTFSFGWLGKEKLVIVLKKNSSIEQQTVITTSDYEWEKNNTVLEVKDLSDECDYDIPLSSIAYIKDDK
jgi:hypothetical protein